MPPRLGSSQAEQARRCYEQAVALQAKLDPFEARQEALLELRAEADRLFAKPHRGE